MLKLFETFQNTQVLSLRIGGVVAKVVSPIINPNNLYIEGWHVIDSRSNENLILLSQDIRDVMPQGLVVNDVEVLTPPEDLIRLQDVLELNFELLKLKVQSQNGKRYGKVSDFAIETQNFYIQKLYVTQALRALSGTTLSIDRSQIIEITNKRIIIEDPTEKSTRAVPAATPIN